MRMVSKAKLKVLIEIIFLSSPAHSGPRRLPGGGGGRPARSDLSVLVGARLSPTREVKHIER